MTAAAPTGVDGQAIHIPETVFHGVSLRLELPPQFDPRLVRHYGSISAAMNELAFDST
jgi:hypothetical protein